MDIQAATTIAGSIITTLGGWKSIEYLLNRKSNSRIAEAEADMKELEVLKAQLVIAQEQLERQDKRQESLHESFMQLMQDNRQKEERFQEQLKANHELMTKIDEQSTEIAKLKAILSMKLCEVRGCPKRQPDSGF